MLIKLAAIHNSPSPQSIPLANAFLKAYSQSSSVEIELFDFFLADNPKTCALKLAELAPIAIGFSIYLWNKELTCIIANQIRQLNPEIILFSGGPEVTADPESVLKTKLFDFVITGEGELPFLSLCKAFESGKSYSNIPGILFSDSINFSSPPAIPDLDLIPSPYLSGVIDTTKNPGILWQLSRGCSFTCDFCFDSRGIHGVRHFSLKRVEAELQHFAATGVRQVFVLDSTFNVDPKRSKAILRLIKKIAPDIHFHFEVRSEFIDIEMAELFAEIPCSLQIGLQSSDSEVLKLVGRYFKKNDFTAKIAILNNTGATFGFDLIYGLPGDTLAGFTNSLDYALSLYPNHLDIFPLAILPGTRLSSNAYSMNLRWDKMPPYLLEETESFSKIDMAAAALLATVCDIFYTRGKAVAWFNAIIKFLDIKGSEFLSKFGQWMLKSNFNITKEADFADSDIFNMQKQFLTSLLNNKKHIKFLPLVIDLIKYHQNYAEVLQSSGSNPTFTTKSLTNICNENFKVSDSARIIYFEYDIDELLECGEPQINWMFKNLQQSGSQAVMYLHNGNVYTESLDTPFIHLLEEIRDTKGKVSLSKAGISKKDASEFLIFAVEEGILEIKE